MIKLLLILLTAGWGTYFCLGSMIEALEYIRLYPEVAAQLGMKPWFEVIMWMGAWLVLLWWLIRAGRP